MGPPFLPVATDTGSQSSLAFSLLYGDSLGSFFSVLSEIHEETVDEVTKLEVGIVLFCLLSVLLAAEALLFCTE